MLFIGLIACSAIPKVTDNPTSTVDPHGSLHQARIFAGALLNKPSIKFIGNMVDMNSSNFNIAQVVR